MLDRIKAIYARIKAVGRRVQARAVVAGLAVLYLTGMGVAKLHLLVFRRSLLRPPPADADSFWLPSSVGSYPLDKSLRQS